MNELWEAHARVWRDPAEVATQWADASSVDPRLLRQRARGGWWDTLERAGVTLLATREYEHLAVSLGVRDGRPQVGFLPVPHPSGLAVDRDRGVAHLASTRNPNQVYDLAPATGLLDRPDVEPGDGGWRPLVPLRSRFLPGAMYLHDLALVGGLLHGNAVGQNAVVELADDGRYRPVWWPRCVDGAEGRPPLLSRNHLQLNSIAAGPDLARSYFSASAEEVTWRRPGQRNFPVDGRGVVFAGSTRQPVMRGLTRPHSARLHGGLLWVANSGYGELVVGPAGGDGEDGYDVVARLPGWTRGLCFAGGVAFAATSRVIPRFRRYAPGLDVDASVCAVHALDVETGADLGSLVWPYGNQVFALDWLPSPLTSGFPFSAGRRGRARERNLFYGFTTARDCHPSGEEMTDGP
ncbi:MAG: DUF4915 domain-containing protein [Acidimicrobiia bacterium]